MTKKVGLCQECGRTVYTNDIDLCKRCYNDVGLEILNKREVVEDVEEEEPSMEDLGIEEGTEETTEEVQEESPAEEVKEKPAEEVAEETKQ